MKRVLKYSKFLAIANLALASSAFAADIQTEVSASLGYESHNIKHDIGIDMKNAFKTTVANGVDLGGKFKHDVKLNAMLLGVGLNTTIDSFVINASAKYGHIYSGKETYNSSGLTVDGAPPYGSFEDFSEVHSNAKKKRGNSLAAEAGLGYLIDCNSFSLIPSIGYSHESLNIKKYMHVHGDEYRASSAKHTISWSGPYLELKSHFKASDDLNLNLSARYTFAKYKGKTKGSYLDRFRYNGNNRGNILAATAGLDFAIDEDQKISTEYCFAMRKASVKRYNTTIEIPDASGESIAKGKIKHNSHMLLVNYTYSF